MWLKSRAWGYKINFVLLALWFGGFTVYAGIVIPIGSEMIGETTQGFITQKVSYWLNIIGFLSVTALIGWTRYFQREQIMGILVGTLLICLLIQFALHIQLTKQLNMEALEVVHRGSFYTKHQVYLWVSTLQWLAMLGTMIKIRLISEPTSMDGKG